VQHSPRNLPFDPPKAAQERADRAAAIIHAVFLVRAALSLISQTAAPIRPGALLAL
jgi:hypothetical protein